MAEIAAKHGQIATPGLAIDRRFSSPGIHPFDEIEWEIRDAVIGDPDDPAFEQRGVEFPTSWSSTFSIGPFLCRALCVLRLGAF